jgi:hypothetical protein
VKKQSSTAGTQGEADTKDDFESSMGLGGGKRSKKKRK